MQTKKTKKIFIPRFQVALTAVVLVGALGVASIANANTYEEKINQLQTQNNQAQSDLNALYAEASSFQAAVDQLNAQILTVQAQINANEVEQARIQSEIVKNQQLIDQKKLSLSASIKAMYLDGQMSTIEQLATSKDLSEYIDKEEYRSAVQSSLNVTIAEINTLQETLVKQKLEIDFLVVSQKAQKEQLAVAQTEQARLLAFNQEQQANFNSQIAANSGQIAELRRLQAAENARLSAGKVIGGRACDAGNGDTYPAQWCNDSYPSYVIDNWGMYTRECVSYTAWKVHESGRHMPYWGGVGNANQWDDNARQAGIPVDTSPRKGDVAVSNAGRWGHVMYVEHVYSNGSILVSDYNQQFDGVYRSYEVSSSTIANRNLQFIHF